MAGRIPQRKVDEIYNTVDILDIVSDFVEMKKRGSNYFGLSPWVDEKTPSFSVSPTKNIFKDFSSGKGGNAITFLMELEGMSYVEALLYVAKKYGIEIEYEEGTEDKEYKDKRESLYILNEFAAKWFHGKLKLDQHDSRVAMDYFKERGILEATIDTFQMGWAPDEFTALADEAKRKQFSEEYLVETGLCFKSDKDQKLIDRFRGRVMFPIHNHLGKVIGFGGRILGKKDKTAKYINSPESEIYHKAKVLYGLYFSKQAIRDKDQAIFVEGYMDVVSLYQHGIKNVIATSGTALSPEQIRLLKRFSRNATLIFDSDRAGIAAALRGADLLLEQDVAVKVLLLPEGHDPDSFVQEKGKTGFEEFLAEQATDFVDFKISHLQSIHPANDPTAKAQIVHEVAETIAKIPDNVSRGIYIQFAAERMGVGIEIVQNALKTALAAKYKQQQKQERFDQARAERAGEQTAEKQIEKQLRDAPRSPLYYQEREVLRLMLNYSTKAMSMDDEEPVTVIDYIFQEVGEFEFEDEVMELVRNYVFEQMNNGDELNLDPLLTHEDKRVPVLVTDLITNKVEVSENWGKFDIRAPQIDEKLDEAVISPLLHYKLRKVRKLWKESQDEIKKEQDSAKLTELAKKNQYLKTLEIEISKILGITYH